MNNINTGIVEAPKSPATKTKMPEFLDKIIAKMPPQVKVAFAKFYSNKMIFWPVTIVFGILFLVIVLGLLFGNRGGQNVPVRRATPTPAPFVRSTPAPCSGNDILCVTGNTLNDLNSKIESLDLKQSRLAPPQINYDISF